MPTHSVEAVERVLGVEVTRHGPEDSLYQEIDLVSLIPVVRTVADQDPPLWEVYVFPSADDVVALTNDDGSPLSADPSERRLGWYRDDHPGGTTWIGVTTYPDNVQLVWMSRERAVDEEWRRLDAALLSL